MLSSFTCKLTTALCLGIKVVKTWLSSENLAVLGNLEALEERFVSFHTEKVSSIILAQD